MTNEFEDDAPNVAGWEPTLPQRAPEATVDIPDTAQNVIAPPTRTWASIANDYADIYSDEALTAPYEPNPNRYEATAGIGSTLGRIGGMLSGSIAPESAPGLVREATRPLNYFPIGRGVAGVAKGAGAAFSAYGGSQLGEELTEGKGETAEALGGAVGSLVGGIGGLKGLNRTSLGALAKEEVGGLRLPGGKKPTQAVAQATDELTDPVTALVSRIKDAKPLQGQNAELLHQFRGRQAGAFSTAVGEGEAGFNKGLGALLGTADRVGFEPLRAVVGQQGVDDLFSRLKQAPLRAFEHASAGTALRNIMDGVVPVPSELAQLERAFPGVSKALQDAKIISGPGLGAELGALLQVPQSLKSAFDLSGFRQTATASYAHPVMAGKAFAQSLKAAVSEKNLNAIDADLAGRWYADLRNDAGVVLADGEIGLSAVERTKIARLVNQIPGYRPSQRAYATMLNVMRDGLFQHMLKDYGGDPRKVSDDTLRQWGRLVNAATGRGDIRELNVLGRKLGTNAVTDNKVFGTPLFWAPRLFLSRVQMPFEMLSSNPQVRKEAIRQMLAFVSVNSTIVGTGAALGMWEAETDPKSADFMQIRIGNQRIDPWAGFRPLVNVLTRFTTGQVKSTTSGETYDKERGQIILDFLRQKFSPATAIAANTLTGENAIGEPYTGGEFAKDALLPLFFDNIIEAVRVEGASGLPGAALGGLGAGVNTYESSAPNQGGGTRRPSRPSRPRPKRPARPTR